MKIAVIVARVLLGLVYTASSLFFFLGMMPEQKLGASAEQFMTGLFVSGYVMPIVKVLELVCGIALIAGRFVPLSLVMIFPITLNVLLFHGFLAPEGVLIPLLMLIANLFLAYQNRESYRMMLAM